MNIVISLNRFNTYCDICEYYEQLCLPNDHSQIHQSIQLSVRQTNQQCRACVISVKTLHLMFIRTSWTSEFVFSCAGQTTALVRVVFAGIVSLIRCISRLFLTTLTMFIRANVCFVRATVHITHTLAGNCHK